MGDMLMEQKGVLSSSELKSDSASKPSFNMAAAEWPITSVAEFIWAMLAPYAELLAPC